MMSKRLDEVTMLSHASWQCQEDRHKDKASETKLSETICCISAQDMDICTYVCTVLLYFIFHLHMIITTTMRIYMHTPLTRTYAAPQCARLTHVVLGLVLALVATGAPRTKMIWAVAAKLLLVDDSLADYTTQIRIGDFS